MNITHSLRPPRSTREPDARERPRPRAQARKDHWDAVTARILEAAALCIIKSGTRTSMERIAAEADVSRGVLYRHFHSRNDLVDAVLAKAIDDHMKAAVVLIDQQADLQAQLTTAIQLILSPLPQLVTVALHDNPTRWGHRLTGAWRAFWLARTVLAQSKGEVRDWRQPDEIADFITRVQLSLITVVPPTNTDEADLVAKRLPGYVVAGIANNGANNVDG